MRKLVFGTLALGLFLFPILTQAQFITHGPVVGGVTDTSAQMYVRTHAIEEVRIELSEDTTFTSVFTHAGTTRDIQDTAVIISVSGLNPETKYYYRCQVAGQYDTLLGSFSTFPEVGQKGDYKIVVGSCDYSYNPQLFEQIEAWQPDLFIHLGDWGWPPNAGGPNFNLDPYRVADTYTYRYSDENFTKHIFRTIPVEYVYDDDMAINDTEGWTYPREGFVQDSNGVITNFIEYDSLAAGTREGAIAGYYRNFPTYPAVDTTDGIYHKFNLGNVEIFMTDNRSSRTPRANAYTYDASTNLWSFEPDTTVTLLGPQQRAWLKDGLRNSEADWKIIGTGVVFNRKYRRFINIGLLDIIQNQVFNFAGRVATGVMLSTGFVYNWAGNPVDLNAMLELKNEGVKDMIMVSGDSHSGVLDDGTNAGIPEMNASGLAAGDEGFLNYYIDSIMQSIGFPSVEDSLWNGGGNGVSNSNFSDTYGTIETFGSDSLRMCIIDEFGQTLGCVTILNSSIAPNSTNTHIYPDHNIIKVLYPNPARDALQVQFAETYTPSSKDRCAIIDAAGKTVWVKDFSGAPLQNFTIDITSFSSGTYFLNYAGENVQHSITFVVSK